MTLGKLLNETKKSSKAEMKKLAGLVKKAYNTDGSMGAFESAIYTNSKTPSITIRFKEKNSKKITIVFKKGFDWQNSVDMALFHTAELSGDDISNADFIFYDPNSDYGKNKSNRVYQASISAYARDIMNVNPLTETLTEAYKGNVTTNAIDKLEKKLKMLTKYNNVSESYLAIAEFLEEDAYITELKTIVKDRNELGYNANTERMYVIYKELMKIGLKSYGKEIWNKKVYKNT